MKVFVKRLKIVEKVMMLGLMNFDWLLIKELLYF